MDNYGLNPQFVLYYLYASIIFPDKYSEKTDTQVIINIEKTIQTHLSS